MLVSAIFIADKYTCHFCVYRARGKILPHTTTHYRPHTCILFYYTSVDTHFIFGTFHIMTLAHFVLYHLGISIYNIDA